MCVDMEMNSSVVQFYQNGHVFLTGGTGFMGKILLDKLLRQMSEQVAHVYVLIRTKKGKDTTVRAKELFEDPVFERLKMEVPSFRSKVTCIAGDCGQPRLGMTDSDRQHIADRVTHVFHCAATVRFDEKLKLAIGINVQGVQEMIKFCKECSKLKSVVHVSTAYANCPRESIMEDFYDPPLSGENALRLVKVLDDEKIEKITPELISPWPNTYSYTKAIAEGVIKEESKDLPMAIFRPSIVIGTSQDPVPGWIDNLYGPTGVVVGVGAGLLRVMFADSNMFADLVPVDMAVSCLLCAAWEVGTKPNNNSQQDSLSNVDEAVKQTKTEPKIYNYVASVENPLTWGEFLHYNLHYGKKIPSIRAIWYYMIILTRMRWLYTTLIMFLHLLPALVMDTGLVLAGRKPQMWKAYAKIHKFQHVIGFFSTKKWNFGESNTLSLWQKLNSADKQSFNFEMRSLNWDEFFQRNVHGIRRYLFQEDPSTVPAARRKMVVLHIAHRAVQLVFFFLCFWTLSSLWTMLPLTNKLVLRTIH